MARDSAWVHDILETIRLVRPFVIPRRMIPTRNAGLAACVAPITYCVALCANRRFVCLIGLLGCHQPYRVELSVFSSLGRIATSIILRSDLMRDKSWRPKDQETCARDRDPCEL